ncbi:MAG: hypothetical protein PUB53_03015 [Bacteroidales bacterium]|nr:hypothetical protein [Bacteroidales bacterium]
MKKYIQPAINVYEIKMESALLGNSKLPDMSTSTEIVDTEEYSHHSIWDNTDWSQEE